MIVLRRMLSIWVLFSFLITSITPSLALDQSFSSLDISNLPFQLPKPGTRVNLSPVFRPVLIKGLKVHPENPLIFDFIVDPGDEKLSTNDFKKVSQRMVNYFLASLAIPEKDLWVNLSPVEKNHIIPDALIKTELGRDLLAEDYMLKQIGASLIYPDSSFGKRFWDKVYNQAYQKFGATQIPVNLFNKIWILPEKASVFEKGETVYIVNAHLKVMLEDDLLAQKRLGTKIRAGDVPVKGISKQVLREIVIPAVEQEVNEDKNFAPLRQVFYALILAQWYEDVFKESILNKDYSGRKKVAGIDVSNPKNKDLIYRQYLSAYKRGVFNYIKEETDRFSQQPIPRKYFSGGFVGLKVKRESVSSSYAAQAMSTRADVDIQVKLNTTNAAQIIELPKKWYNMQRPLGLFKELKRLFVFGHFNYKGFYDFIDKYSAQVDSETLDPVEGAWPVLKAFTLLEKDEEDYLVGLLRDKYLNPDHPDPNRPELVDKILLMNKIFDRKKWPQERTPRLKGREIYLVAAEEHYWTGGLGPVMEFLGFGDNRLGENQTYIGIRYKKDIKGDDLNYVDDPNIGYRELEEDIFKDDPMVVDVGDINGKDIRRVKMQVARGIDKHGIPAYIINDVQADGSSYYTNMLYQYGYRGSVKREAFTDAEWKALMDSGYIDSEGEILPEFDRPANYFDMNLPGMSNPEKEKLYNALKNVKNKNLVSKEESMAFLNVASAELIKRLEEKRRQKMEKEQKGSWKSAIVHSNDGQFAPLQAVMMSRYGSDPVIKGILYAFTTHTYMNRGVNSDVRWAIDVFLKHMMGIKNRYINAFRRGDHYIDHTSGGVRLAHVKATVSRIQRLHVQHIDPDSTVISLTNGTVPEEMAETYREEFMLQQEVIALRQDEFHKLQDEGLIPKTADFERPTAQELALVKRACKQRLNNANIRTANGDLVRVDLDKPLLGNARRGAEEKAGLKRAMPPENIKMLVEEDANLLLMYNKQLTKESRALVNGLKDLEKSINAQKLPGKFQFVDFFTRLQKVIVLAALDGELMDSDDNEANGTGEEDGAANGAYILTGRWDGNGIGALAQQGIELTAIKHYVDGQERWDYRTPGEGNILMPQADNPKSWRETVFAPFMRLWKSDPDHHSFYEGSKLGPRLNRASYYLLTAAANLRAYEKVLEQQEKRTEIDHNTEVEIIDALQGARDTLKGILYEGRNGVQRPFEFEVFGQSERFYSRGNGLRQVVDRKTELEDLFGYDAFLHHLGGGFRYDEREQQFTGGHFQSYLGNIFHGTGRASEIMNRWIINLENDPNLTKVEKAVRMGQFAESLATGLERNYQGIDNNAMKVTPGGIKLDHIPLERQGSSMIDLVSDKAFENMLLKAQGLYGTIVAVTPIPDLLNFIQ